MDRCALSMKKIYEADLFKPVQHYFQSLGYEVQAEVEDCDVVAFNETSLIIIELKLNLNITLLMQAAKRQRLTQEVYIAIQRPKQSLRRRRWRDLLHLIRRLELGLILISFDDEKPKLEVVHEPGPFNRKRSMQQSRKKRDRLIEEASSRRSNSNIGGSHQTTTMTAYKETCIQIAFYLDYLGAMSSKELQKLGTGHRTYRILYNNYNQWFKRVARGTYGLTQLGIKEYKKYPEIIELYMKSDLPE